MRRWIPRTCELCGLTAIQKNHVGSRYCRVVADTRFLFGLGLVPYPRGHSLPGNFPMFEAFTAGEYGLLKFGRLGEGRGEAQWWAPFWVRCLTESFVRPLTSENRALRNRLIERGTVDQSFAEHVEAVWRLGGEGAVVGFCRGLKKDP